MDWMDYACPVNAQDDCVHTWRPSGAGPRPPKDSAESHVPWETSEILDVHARLGVNRTSMGWTVQWLP